MSFLQYSDGIKASDLQVWNNAAFDNGDSDERFSSKDSWFSSKPIFVNRSETFDLDSSKENQNPVFSKSPVSVKSPIPIKPLHPNGAIENSQGKPLKLLFKQGLRCPSPTIVKNGSAIGRDGSNIDMEIEEIEMEISRLSSKVEALRLEKEEKNLNAFKTNEEILADGARTKFRQRGFSLGPSEIVTGVRSRPTEKLQRSISFQSRQNRRKSCFSKLQEIDEEKMTRSSGISLGPLEINKNVRSQVPVKLERTPIQSNQKLGSLNLQEINSDKVTKQRGGRSLSPKSRLPVSMIQASKRGLTTIGSKKSVKKENGILSSIQPKKLFSEGEKSVCSKKPVKNGRVITSRYNEIPLQSAGNQKLFDQRKRSLPEGDKEDLKRCDKKHNSSVGKSDGFLPECSLNKVNEGRVKKRWEIPSEIIMHESMVESPPPSNSNLADCVLPKIRTNQCANESPRDSGPAKRVAELIGRKSYFGAPSRGVETSVCQALSFEEEDEEE